MCLQNLVRCAAPELVTVSIAKALEAAVNSDRAFFDSHPEALSRERDFIPGESPFPNPPHGYEVRVRVTQLSLGVRTREIFMRSKIRVCRG
jgi:hypothetical protein